MHWRHWTEKEKSERLYTPDAVWRYKDLYYDDYYTPDAPISLTTYGICSRAPESRIINRYPNKYIFHYILSGSGWCNGVPFEAGDIVYCVNNVPYSLASNSNDPCVLAWISFAGGKSDKYVAQMGITKPFLCYKAAAPDTIARVLFNMIEENHPGVEEALYLESCLLHLLALSVPPKKDPEPPQTQTAKNEKCIEDAIRYISEHFREPTLSLAEISACAERNTKYLQHLFHKKFGMGLHEYLTKTRLDAAEVLLTSSSYNINEIADYVGYSDRRTFTNAFKKRFGIPPAKYRP